MKKIFVNITDKGMSGHGLAKGGKSYFCVECETLDQAEAVEKAASEMTGFIRIAISEKPRTGGRFDHTSIKHICSYTPGYGVAKYLKTT